MSEVLGLIPREVEQLRRACFAHARDLIQAAELLQHNQLPHLSYHLATLALEEVGKAELIVMQAISRARGEEAGWIARQLESHTKKLFIALLGPQFGSTVITGELLSDLQTVASEAHAQRLRGLYVDASDELAPPPRAAISPDQAETAINLADATLGLAEKHEFVPLSDEEEGNMLWFFEAVDDPEKRKLVLGGPSLRKMAELHGGQAWIAWVREQFIHAEEEGRALAEQEIARRVGEAEDEVKEKWKLQVRIFSDSHSVRAKALQGWNESIDWLKLIYVQKKNQFLVEITFPRRMHVGTLYDAGLGVMQDFVLALNIGTGGFFWWYLPEYISKYYLSARDLESGSQVTVELTPKLRVDWGNRVLDQQQLHDVKLCFAALTLNRFPRKDSPFGHYLSGLALLAKNDILLRLEATAYEQFFRALRLGMQTFGDWRAGELFAEAFGRVFKDLIGEHPGEQWLKWGESLVDQEQTESLTLSETGMMKALCDIYFREVLVRSLHRRAESEDQQDAIVDDASS